MQNDNRLTQCRGIASIKCCIPLSVFLTKADHDNVSFTDSLARANCIQLGTFMVFPEIILFGSQYLHPTVITRCVIGHRCAQLHVKTCRLRCPLQSLHATLCGFHQIDKPSLPFKTPCLWRLCKSSHPMSRCLVDSRWHPHKRMLTLPTEDLCIRLNIYDLYCPAIASTSSVSFAGCGALNFYQTGVAYALQETGQTARLHFLGASAGAGLAFTTAAGLDAREVAATMAQWITGYGPGRILKPAWAFEVATRFGEHFVNRERFEKVLGRLTVSVTEQAPFTNHLISRFSSESALSEALVASCFIPYPGQWNLPAETSGRWMAGLPTINHHSIPQRFGCHPFGLRPEPRSDQRLRFSQCRHCACRPSLSAGGSSTKVLSTHKRGWSSRRATRKMGRLSRFSYPQSSKNRAA